MITYVKKFHTKITQLTKADIVRIILLLSIIGIFIALTLYLKPDILLGQIQSHRGALIQIVHEHFIISSILYISLLAVETFFSTPLGVVLSISSGYFFGTVIGALYTTIGATLGAVLAFTTVRYLLYSHVKELYRKKYHKFYNTLANQGTYYIISLHFLPATPFFFVNMVAALTPISLLRFTIATCIGVIPESWVYSLIGRTLENINTIYDLLSPRIIILFILLALMALIPLFIGYKWPYKPKK